MLDIFTYQDRQIRTVAIDGEPWFVLADVCRVIDVDHIATVRKRLPDGVVSNHPISDSLGRTQQATIVNEAGLYRVVLRSDKPEAEPFIEWVTSDVLPTIRKTGQYGSGVDMLAALPSSQLLLMASEAAKKAEEATAALAIAAPKADRWDDLVAAAGTYGVGDVAKLLASRLNVEIGRTRLFGKLEEHGWIYRQGGCWHTKQWAVEQGLIGTRANHPVTNLKTGELRAVDPTVRITGKGLDKLATLLGPIGSVA